MPGSKITVKDLARICGVSIGTIDRAINDRPNIKPATKEMVLAAAKEHGFVKNQNALMLSKGRSSLIGVIIPDLETEFLTSLITGIEARAAERGCSAIIMLSRWDCARELECAKRMRAMNIAGLIVLSVMRDVSYYRELESVGVSVIAVGNRADSLPFVGIDDAAAMKAGTEYVLSRGWERLIYVAPMLEKGKYQNISAQSERLRGFNEAVRLSSVEACVLGTKAEYNELFPHLSERSPDKRTAVICPTDVYTLRALPLLKLGYGLLCFDRLPLLATLFPKLAGITCPTEETAKRAVDALLDGVQGDLLLPFELHRAGSI